MYLLPSEKEMAALWKEISPQERFLRSVRQAVDYACRPDGDSMAAFFLNSESDDLREEGYVTPDPYNYAGVDLGEKVEWDEI